MCYQLGVKHIVFSPGSRNAPLIISFARHEKIKKWIIPDERSAGFVALGIAQEIGQPVALCCTSGTALLNYAPAIAEAYYRQLPLIVLSADRPPELIDQRDGQTIRQYEALSNHVKQTVQLPVVMAEADAEAYQQSLITSITSATELPKGPVHLNIPFREPFYPDPDTTLQFDAIPLSHTEEPPTAKEKYLLPGGAKALLLIGQQETTAELNELTAQVAHKIPIIRSPLNNLEAGIAHVEAFINNQKALAPELLITSGLSVLSKKLKNYLRKYTPKYHLHFDEAGVPVDTYQSNPQLIQGTIEEYLPTLLNTSLDASYLETWKSYEACTSAAIHEFMRATSFSEAKASYDVFNRLPEDSILHLSNSMPVRYADLFGINHSIISRSNRGTSGIDGCTSTALGNSLVSQKLNILVTGDLAFLYDRNAFFNNYTASNLRIIVMNNQGGGIFRLIDGPSRLPELNDYFETRHDKSARYICKENDIDYFTISSEEELALHWTEFLKPSANTKLMEVFTDPKTNQEVYKNLKSFIHERINSLEESTRL